MESRPGFLIRGRSAACLKTVATTSEDRVLLMTARPQLLNNNILGLSQISFRPYTMGKCLPNFSLKSHRWATEGIQISYKYFFPVMVFCWHRLEQFRVRCVQVITVHLWTGDIGSFIIVTFVPSATCYYFCPTFFTFTPFAFLFNFPFPLYYLPSSLYLAYLSFFTLDFVSSPSLVL